MTKEFVIQLGNMPFRECDVTDMKFTDFSTSYEDKMKALKEQISLIEARLKVLSQEKLDVYNTIIEKDNELIGLLTFGKQKEKIGKLHKEIEELELSAKEIEIEIHVNMSVLENLGNRYNEAYNKIQNQKEQEREIRKNIIEKLINTQVNLHQLYLDLEDIKMKLSDGEDINQFITEGKLVLNGIEVNLTEDKITI